MHLSTALQGREDPATTLAEAADYEALARQLEHLGVIRAREAGWSWERIASALGTSPARLRKRHRREGSKRQAAR
ncbi:MAG: hypothetical protein WCF12_00210 [Propionicimonas sp.]